MFAVRRWMGPCHATQDPGRAALKPAGTGTGATYPWPAFRCRLISFSPSMIHCMIFWFFSASSDEPGTSVLPLFPDSAFLAFRLEVVPAFPLQKPRPRNHPLTLPGSSLDGWPPVLRPDGSLNLGVLGKVVCFTGSAPALWGCLGLFPVASRQEMKEGVQAVQAGKASTKGQLQHWPSPGHLPGGGMQSLATPPPRHCPLKWVFIQPPFQAGARASPAAQAEAWRLSPWPPQACSLCR